MPFLSFELLYFIPSKFLTFLKYSANICVGTYSIAVNSSIGFVKLVFKFLKNSVSSLSFYLSKSKILGNPSVEIAVRSKYFNSRTFLKCPTAIISLSALQSLLQASNIEVSILSEA